MSAYLDNAATTRLHPEVRDAMVAVTAFANPSSLHRLGREARDALEAARDEVARVLRVDSGEIYFTSGATEANNLAILGAARAADAAAIVTTAVEHSAVLEPCRHLRKRGRPLTIVDCDRDGRVAADAVLEAVTEETALISIMLANNEVGTLQPVAEVATAGRSGPALVHCDAAQASGKMSVRPRELGVDLLTLSGHKMHGPRGVGVLYVRSGVVLEPLVHGGGHERSLRPGTENVIAAVGFARALAVAERDLDENRSRMSGFRARLREAVAGVPGLVCHADGVPSLPSILSFSVPGLLGDALVVDLDMRDVQVSSGSACESRSVDPSHVLKAMAVPDDLALGTLRLSVAADTTEAEIEHAVGVVPETIERFLRLRAR